MGSEFESVLAEFKANERPEDIIPILSDEGAQKLVVAWPKIIIRRKDGEMPVPGPVNEKWTWLWDQVEFSERELIETSGIPEMKVKRLFSQVKGNRLIYPDGAMAGWAQKILRKKVVEGISKI